MARNYFLIFFEKDQMGKKKVKLVEYGRLGQNKNCKVYILPPQSYIKYKNTEYYHLIDQNGQIIE